MHICMLLFTQRSSLTVLQTLIMTDCPQMGWPPRIHANQVVTQRLRWTAFQTWKKSSAFFKRMPLRKADWTCQAAHIGLLFYCWFTYIAVTVTTATVSLLLTVHTHHAVCLQSTPAPFLKFTLLHCCYQWVCQMKEWQISNIGYKRPLWKHLGIYHYHCVHGMIMLSGRLCIRYVHTYMQWLAHSNMKTYTLTTFGILEAFNYLSQRNDRQVTTLYKLYEMQ